MQCVGLDPHLTLRCVFLDGPANDISSVEEPLGQQPLAQPHEALLLDGGQLLGGIVMQTAQMEGGGRTPDCVRAPLPRQLWLEQTRRGVAQQRDERRHISTGKTGRECVTCLRISALLLQLLACREGIGHLEWLRWSRRLDLRGQVLHGVLHEGCCRLLRRQDHHITTTGGGIEAVEPPHDERCVHNLHRRLLDDGRLAAGLDRWGRRENAEGSGDVDHRTHTVSHTHAALCAADQQLRDGLEIRQTDALHVCPVGVEVLVLSKECVPDVLPLVEGGRRGFW
mmetsp:Transcript_17680/g.50255  ORF Transcript_17680/g.50255 Transcript_17680/m.50255 type:complete len:282 (-) Transcript_17680:343-1188(-)